MLWVVLVAMVGVVMLSVQGQLKRENEVACVTQLCREYTLCSVYSREDNFLSAFCTVKGAAMTGSPLFFASRPFISPPAVPQTSCIAPLQSKIPCTITMQGINLYFFSTTPCFSRSAITPSTTACTSSRVRVRSAWEKKMRTVMDLPASSV